MSNPLAIASFEARSARLRMARAELLQCYYLFSNLAAMEFACAVSPSAIAKSTISL